jgi:glycosyltransferase involved in cell wall biosynthesis
MLTTDSREHIRDYGNPQPSFGTAPAALFQGFDGLGEVKFHIVSCTRQPMRSPGRIADNIWFHSLVVPKIGWIRTGYQGCIRAVRKKLREIQPDIVHGQGTERDCAISAVFSGFPNVVTIHGNMAELARMFHARVGSYSWLAGKLENFTLPRTAGVFCNSAYTENLIRPRAKKTWRVPNALRREFFEAIPGGTRPCVLLNVGAISERKRQLEILDMTQKLRARGLKFEMHFIGPLNPSDAYAAAFAQRLKSLEATGCARHLGELDTPELIRRFDSSAALLHFPSEESFGLVVAEALARNLKLFASRIGGITDIAEGSPGAELFDVNDVNGLTEAIAGWIARGHPPAQGGGVMRERYHPTVVARRHLEIYAEILSFRSPQPLKT